MPVTTTPPIAPAPIPTWFGIGGHAERFARPASHDELRALLELEPNARILGDGANLLVDDDGVPELVLSLKSPAFAATAASRDEPVVRAGAGADLPRLILECTRLGLAGLEGLGGIPATVGGAVIMNAGGAFGQIADRVARVHALDRHGLERTIERRDIAFAYRHSGLTDLVITSVELTLAPSDPKAVRDRLKDVMGYKKCSQPMADRSAGCCFKNALLNQAFTATKPTGERFEFPAGKLVPAGLLIELAGCKGLSVGGASVSQRHANFLVTTADAKARHVIDLMHEVARRVRDTFGITLQREVVVWSRHTRSESFSS